jgi:hypothetical protein
MKALILYALDFTLHNSLFSGAQKTALGTFRPRRLDDLCYDGRSTGKLNLARRRKGYMIQDCTRRATSLLSALLISGLLTGMVYAQAPKPPATTATPAANKPAETTVKTPEPPEKVVLKVGNQQFTKADIDFLIDFLVENLGPQVQRTLAAQGKKQLGDEYASVVMLSQHAQNLHLDQTSTFERALALQKQRLEAQVAYKELDKQVKVTPEDVQQYYTAHADDYDEILVRQIVVRERATNPPPGPGQSTTGPGLPAEEAKARAEAIRKELAAGTDIKKVMEDFKAPGDIIIEPEPRKVRRRNMRPEMEKVAFELKPGEVSEVFNVPQALAFFQVTAHSRLELKDVTSEIERMLHQQKLDAALAEVKKNFPIWMDEEYFAPPPKPPAAPAVGAPAAETHPNP